VVVEAVAVDVAHGRRARGARDGDGQQGSRARAQDVVAAHEEHEVVAPVAIEVSDVERRALRRTVVVENRCERPLRRPANREQAEVSDRLKISVPVAVEIARVRGRGVQAL
jgi:hypothetical protein